MKKCRECQEVKPFDKFSRDKYKPDGLTGNCKECQKKAARHYRETHKETPEQRAHRLARAKQYRATPERMRQTRIVVRAYRQRPDVKVQRREYFERTYQIPEVRERIRSQAKAREQTDKGRAKRAVNNAILRGRFPRIATRQCADCGGQAQQYHHESYKPEHWLDVIPLCIRCHKKRQWID